MDRDAFVGHLNALADEIPPEAFRRTGDLNRVVYVIRYIGDGRFPYHNQLITKGRVLYVGRGLLVRATKQFKGRGKVIGRVGRDFDAFIADEWPNFELFLAASIINPTVAAEFECILRTRTARSLRSHGHVGLAIRQQSSIRLTARYSS